MVFSSGHGVYTRRVPVLTDNDFDLPFRDNLFQLLQHSFHLNVVFLHPLVGHGVKQRLVIVVHFADPVIRMKYHDLP